MGTTKNKKKGTYNKKSCCVKKGNDPSIRRIEKNRSFDGNDAIAAGTKGHILHAEPGQQTVGEQEDGQENGDDERHVLDLVKRLHRLNNILY